MARILIIDDEELVRLTLRQMLLSDNHEVFEASNGKDGVAMQKANPADVVITDIIMPGQEGIETIVQLRQADPGLKIIAISGGGRMKNMDFLKVASKLGADAVLSKPFSVKDILSAVQTLTAPERTP